MAFSTLLEIITRVCDETGFASRPTVVVGSSRPDDRRLLACANAAGRDLMKAHEWGSLQTSATITTANGTADYSLASDYDRMISDTGWNRTKKMFLSGPDTPQVNRYLNDGWGVSASINQRFRIKGLTITIWPTPTAIETLGYEYISNKWAQSYDDEENPTDPTPQLEFLADTYTTVFDPELMKKEIIWRFASGKGMYADGLKAEAFALRDQRIASDLGGTILNMVPEPDYAPGAVNVQDGDWDI